MTTNPFDFTKATEDFLKTLQSGANPLKDGLQEGSDFGAKLTQIAIDAARQNAELTNGWTKEVLNKLEKNASSKMEPAELASLTAELSSQESAAMQEKVSAYAEVAKAAQEKTLQLFMAASQEMQANVMNTAKKK